MIEKRAKLIQAKQLLSAIPDSTKTPGGKEHSIISNQLVSIALIFALGVWPFSKLGLIPLFFLLGLWFYSVKKTILEALLNGARDLVNSQLQDYLNISGYDQNADAFRHEDGLHYHDPSADECWNDGTLLFNLNASRHLQDKGEEIVSRVNLGGSNIEKVVMEKFFSSPGAYLKIYLSLDPKERAKDFLQLNLGKRIGL